MVFMVQPFPSSVPAGVVVKTESKYIFFLVILAGGPLSSFALGTEDNMLLKKIHLNDAK